MDYLLFILNFYLYFLSLIKSEGQFFTPASPGNALKLGNFAGKSDFLLKIPQKILHGFYKKSRL